MRIIKPHTDMFMESATKCEIRDALDGFEQNRHIV